MSIDELNNQHEEKRGIVPSVNANNDTLNRNYIPYRIQGIATVSEQSGGKLPLSSQELKALHRVRINRMLMRKRRQGRASKDMVPRIVTTTVIVLAVLTLLVSGSVGA